jgi:hypothetical protein
MGIKLLLEDKKGRDHSEDLGVDGKVMLELILNTVERRVLDAPGSGKDQCRNLMNTEMNLGIPWGGGGVLDYLNDCQLHKKNSVPWSY